MGLGMELAVGGFDEAGHDLCDFPATIAALHLNRHVPMLISTLRPEGAAARWLAGFEPGGCQNWTRLAFDARAAK